MSPQLLGVVEEEGQSNATLLASSNSRDSICQNSSVLKEHNYMGLSECSSVDSSTISSASEDNNGSLNLKATELRLGLPGSQSPERDSELCLLSSAKLDEKPLFPLRPIKDCNFSFLQKTVAAGNKRGFDDAMDSFSKGDSEANILLSPRPPPNLGIKSGTMKDNSPMQPAKMKERVSHNAVQDKPQATNEHSSKTPNRVNAANGAPSNKAQVVGWPPIRSFRKNTLATTSKNTEEVNGKASPSPLFIKVSMVGAPYLRKVDVQTYTTYQELSSALEKMFSCFTIGQYGSHGVPGNEVLSESKLKDLLNGSEYVLTYEDKDGDWMLVGDVPWEMFIDNCKRLRIMKSSDAIGLAPRAVEKCRNRN